MKLSAAALVVYLAGYVAARGMEAGRRSAVVASKWTEATENLNMFNLKASVPQMANNIFTRSIHGSPAGVADLLNNLSIKELQQIEASQFGAPFILSFLDTTTGQYLGDVSGYFSYDGSVQIDPDSQLPAGVKIPNTLSSAGTGIVLTPVTVKASSDVSSKVIQNGKLSDDQLKTLLGSDFGLKPFRVSLTDGSGKEIGYVSGSFSTTGTVIDAANTKIPSPAPPPAPPAPPAPTAHPAPTAPAPSPSPTGSLPDDDDPNANHAQVTISGTGDALKSTLNSLSYDYIKNAVGGKYGPFYISFTSEDGTVSGYIKGTISANNFSYVWKYES